MKLELIRPGARHVVITVHGIRTFGQWQERFRALIRSKDPAIEILNYNFGRFSLIAFFIPFLRWLVTREFRKALMQVARANSENDTRIDLVGHSFGTHLIGWALLGIPEEKRPRVHTVILAGSVLKAGFPWGRLLDQGFVKRVVNECGTKDLILILNQVFILFTGVAGILGFKGMIGERLRNNWYRFGHSGYFSTGNLDEDQFMRERWVPLIVSEEVPEHIDKRPTSEVYNLWVFILQNLELIKLSSYVALASLVALWVAESRQTRAIEEARDLAARADTSRIEHPNRLSESVLLAIESIRRTTTREGDLSLRQGLSILPTLLRVLPHKGNVSSVAFNQDDSEISTVSNGTLVQIWRIRDAAIVSASSTRDRVEALSFSSNPAGVFAVEERGEVALVTERGQEGFTNAGQESEKAAICQGAEGPIFATALHDFTVRVWIGKKHPEIGRLDHDNRLLSLACSKNGKLLATGGYDYSVRVWLLETSPKLRKVLNHSHPVSAVALSPDGALVGFGDTFGSIRIWNLATDQEVPVKIEHSDWVTSLSFSPDGNWIASSSKDSTARIWDAETGQELARMDHDGVVWSVAFGNDGKLVATASEDGTARIWDVSKNLPIKQSGQVCALAFSPDSKLLAAGDTYGNVQTVMLARRFQIGQLRKVQGQKDSVESVAFDASGQGLIVVFDDGILMRFHVFDPGISSSVKLNDVISNSVAISRDGKIIVTADWDGGIHVYDAKGGAELKSSAHPQGALAIAVSADGRLVASGGSDKTARIWAWANGGSVREIPHDESVSAVEFGASGAYLATGAGRVARVWRIDGPAIRKVAELLVDDTVQLLAFSPDDRYLVTSRTPTSAQLWDWSANKVVSEFNLRGAPCSAAFSQDGHEIAIGGVDSYARVLLSTPSTVTTEACRRLGSYFAAGALPLGVSRLSLDKSCSGNR